MPLTSVSARASAYASSQPSIGRNGNGGQDCWRRQSNVRTHSSRRTGSSGSAFQSSCSCALLADQVSPERLINQGLPSIWRHPILHVLQRPPNGRRRDALVASEILVGHVRPVLQLHPLWQRAPHAAARAHTHLRRIELPEPQQIQHGFAVQERAFPGKSHGNRRLSKRVVGTSRCV